MYIKPLPLLTNTLIAYTRDTLDGGGGAGGSDACRIYNDGSVAQPIARPIEHLHHQCHPHGQEVTSEAESQQAEDVEEKDERGHIVCPKPCHEPLWVGE